jgi:carbonic anhydrase
MSELNKILAANEEYSKDFRHGQLSHIPSRKIAILTCMDTRLAVGGFLETKNRGCPHIKKRWWNSYR